MLFSVLAEMIRRVHLLQQLLRPGRVTGAKTQSQRTKGPSTLGSATTVKQPRGNTSNASFDHTVTLAGHPAAVLDPIGKRHVQVVEVSNCTNKFTGKYPIIYKVLYIPTGSLAFLPSTVSRKIVKSHFHEKNKSCENKTRRNLTIHNGPFWPMTFPNFRNLELS